MQASPAMLLATENYSGLLATLEDLGPLTQLGIKLRTEGCAAGAKFSLVAPAVGREQLNHAEPRCGLRSNAISPAKKNLHK